jgi:hypothetical protein
MERLINTLNCKYGVHQVLKLVLPITPSPSTISILFKES